MRRKTNGAGRGCRGALHGSSYLIAVSAVTALGASLRFSTLDIQGFGEDELATAWLMKLDFSELIDVVSESESTPPLYYAVVWGWSQLAGTGEVGLRLLSALAGTALVPVGCEAARMLASRRVGVVTGALLAVNPLLVWYSQEARSYALMLLFSALSFLGFARAVNHLSRPALALWALASALAIATHYFAAFLVAPAAVWLAARSRPRRPALVAACVPAFTGLALLPLALEQRGSLGHFSRLAFLPRLLQIPKNFLVGFNMPAELAVTLFAMALTLVAVVPLAAHGKQVERRQAMLAGGIGAFAVATPVGLAAVGLDYLDSKNVIAAVIPLSVAAAIGFAAWRAGIAAAVALCALSVAVVLSVAADPRYQRIDWRGAAKALGEPSSSRALVISPLPTQPALAVYVPRVGVAETYRVREIAVLGLATVGRYELGTPRPPRPLFLHPPAGFRILERRLEPTFTLIRLQASKARLITYRELLALGLDQEGGAGVFLQAS